MADNTEKLNPLYTVRVMEGSQTLNVNVREKNAPFVVRIGARTSSSNLPGTTVIAGESAYKGFVQYSSSTWSQTIQANTRTKLEFGPDMIQTVNNIDPSLGGHEFFQNDEMIPYGAIPFGKYRLRMNLVANSPIIETRLKFELDIDGIFDTIDSDTYRMFEDSGIDEKISTTFDFYTGSTAISNGGEIYVTSTNMVTLSQGLVLIIVEDVS